MQQTFLLCIPPYIFFIILISAGIDVKILVGSSHHDASKSPPEFLRHFEKQVLSEFFVSVHVNTNTLVPSYMSL